MIHQGWTQQAIECFHTKDCKDCFIKKTIESPCYMRWSVQELIKNYGYPRGLKILGGRPLNNKML